MPWYAIWPKLKCRWLKRVEAKALTKLSIAEREFLEARQYLGGVNSCIVGDQHVKGMAKANAMREINETRKRLNVAKIRSRKATAAADVCRKNLQSE